MSRAFEMFGQWFVSYLQTFLKESGFKCMLAIDWNVTGAFFFSVLSRTQTRVGTNFWF